MAEIEELKKSLKPLSTKAVEVDSKALEPWTHGEILHEETSFVSKFLLVPPHVTDPNEVVRTMLTDFKMPTPRMICSSQSAVGNYWDAVGREMDVGEGTKTSMAKLLSDKEWNWGDPDQVEHNYKAKVTDLMAGVCSAASECNAWLVGFGTREGGAHTGGMFEPGVATFCRSNPTKERITLVGMNGFILGGHNDEHLFGEKPEAFNTSHRPWATIGFPFTEPVDLVAEGIAVPLANKPHKQLVYPKMSRWTTPNPHLAPSEHTIGAGILSPYATHFIFGGRCVEKAREVLEAIVPGVYVVVAGRDRYGGPSSVFDKARRGAQVILMENTGLWVNMIVKAVVAKKNKAGGDCKDAVKDVVLPEGLSCMVPDGIDSSHFLVFDALRDSQEAVIEKLTEVLTTVGGEDMKELGFTQTEQDRLRYAWELYFKFRHNTDRFCLGSIVLQFVISSVALATIGVATLHTASANSEDLDSNSVDGLHVSSYIKLPCVVRTSLALACVGLPLLSTFLQSCSSQFAPDSKHAACKVASVRCIGEIYRYRTRSGPYRGNSKNQALARISAPSNHSSPESAGGVSKSSGPRALFTEQLNSIFQAASHGAMQLESFEDASDHLQMQIIGELHGGETAPSRRSALTRGLLDSKPLQRGTYNAFQAILTESRDDGMSLLTAEDYMTFRVEPAVEALKAKVRRLTLMFYIMKGIMFVGTLAAGLLGVLTLRVFIPFVVGGIASVEGFGNFLHVKERLTSINNGIGSLRSLIFWWNGLSMIERRFPQNKDRLVEVTEEAIELEVSCYGKVAANRQAKESDADENDEQQEKAKNVK